jgi:cytoskeletal protein RodZ
MNYQTGSVHTVLVIGLVVSLMGALGFIFWQNFIQAKPISSEAVTNPTQLDSTKQEVSEPKKATETYDTKEFTFEYSSEGWQKQEKDNPNELARIETTDFKPSIGMGLESGAQLAVSTTAQQEVPMLAGVTNVEEIRISGLKGYRYQIEYEGFRLQAIFTDTRSTDAAKNYSITMETVESATPEEIEAFELVLSTLKVK